MFVEETLSAAVLHVQVPSVTALLYEYVYMCVRGEQSCVVCSTECVLSCIHFDNRSVRIIYVKRSTLGYYKFIQHIHVFMYSLRYITHSAAVSTSCMYIHIYISMVCFPKPSVTEISAFLNSKRFPISKLLMLPECDFYYYY